MNSSQHADEATSALLFDKLKWMTSKEAAFYFRVSVGQLRNMVWLGKIQTYHLGGRLRFLRSDLDQLVVKPNSQLK